MTARVDQLATLQPRRHTATPGGSLKQIGDQGPFSIGETAAVTAPITLSATVCRRVAVVLRARCGLGGRSPASRLDPHDSCGSQRSVHRQAAHPDGAAPVQQRRDCIQRQHGYSATLSRRTSTCCSLRAGGPLARLTFASSEELLIWRMTDLHARIRSTA